MKPATRSYYRLHRAMVFPAPPVPPTVLAAFLFLLSVALAGLAANDWVAHGRGSSTPVPGEILFVDGRPDGTQAGLFTIRSDGQGRQEIATGMPGGAVVGPDWSPDREHAVYARSAPSTAQPEAGHWSLQITDLARGEVRGLTEGPFDQDPDWHPGGAPILFASYVSPIAQAQSSTFTQINPDGTDPRLLVALVSSTHYLTDPDWSPDGLRILFGVHSRAQGGELYHMTAGAAQIQRLLIHPGWDDVDPAWSPDGRRVAFAGGRYRGTTAATRHDIWLLDLATGVAGTIVTDPVLDLRRPAWSPDGTQMVFDAARDAAARRELYIAPVTGGPVGQPITTGWAAAWASDRPITPTAGSASPTPPGGGDPTATITATLGTPTPPVLPTLTPLATLPVFPTLPALEPTSTGPAPSFPPPTATATARPTRAPGGQIYFPSARNNDEPPPPIETPSPAQGAHPDRPTLSSWLLPPAESSDRLRLMLKGSSHESTLPPTGSRHVDCRGCRDRRNAAGGLHAQK